MENIEKSLIFGKFLDGLDESIEVDKWLKGKELKGINDILCETEKSIKDDMENIIYISVSEDTKALLNEYKNGIVKFEKAIPKIKDTFLKDKHYKNGIVQKAVVNILKSAKYRKPLNMYTTKIRQNRKGSYERVFYYICYHDLSAKPIEIARTLNAIEKYLSLLKYALKKHCYFSIGCSMCSLEILLRRIIKLYEFYMNYLNDIKKSSDKDPIKKSLINFHLIVEEILGQCSEYEKYVKEELENEEY